MEAPYKIVSGFLIRNLVNWKAIDILKRDNLKG